MRYNRYTSNVYPGEEFTITHRGEVFDVKIEHDSGSGPPDEDFGHGPVRTVSYRGWGAGKHNLDKRPGEVVLHIGDGTAWLYDVQQATKIARDDGRGPIVPYRTRGQAAAAAVREDMDYLRAWYANDWCWVGMVVTSRRTGEQESLWGIESFGTCAREEVTRELANNIQYDRRKAWRDVLKARREEYRTTRLMRTVGRLLAARPAPLSTMGV